MTLHSKPSQLYGNFNGKREHVGSRDLMMTMDSEGNDEGNFSLCWQLRDGGDVLNWLRPIWNSALSASSD